MGDERGYAPGAQIHVQRCQLVVENQQILTKYFHRQATCWESEPGRVESFQNGSFFWRACCSSALAASLSAAQTSSVPRIWKKRQCCMFYLSNWLRELPSTATEPDSELK